MCVCVCVYIYIYIYIYTYIHTYIHTYIQTHTPHTQTSSKYKKFNILLMNHNIHLPNSFLSISSQTSVHVQYLPKVMQPHVCSMLNLEFSALLEILFLKVMVRASATSHKLTYPYFTTRKHRHMQGHTADKVSHWTKFASYRYQKCPLFLVHVTPQNKLNEHAVVKKHFNVQSMLKNYKCFHLTHYMPTVITPAHAIDNW